MEADDDEIKVSHRGKKYGRNDLDFDLFDKVEKSHGRKKVKQNTNKKETTQKTYNNKTNFDFFDRTDKYDDTKKIKPNTNRRENNQKTYDNEIDYDIFDRTDKFDDRKKMKSNINKKEIAQKSHYNKPNYDLFDRTDKFDDTRKMKSNYNKKENNQKTYNEIDYDIFDRSDRLDDRKKMKSNINKKDNNQKSYNEIDYDIFDRVDKFDDRKKMKSNVKENNQRAYNNDINYDLFDRVEKFDNRKNKKKSNTNIKENNQKPYNNDINYDIFDRVDKFDNRKNRKKKSNTNIKETEQKYNNYKKRDFEDESPEEGEYDETYQQVKKLKDNLIQDNKREKNKFKQKKIRGDESEEEEEEEEEKEKEEEDEDEYEEKKEKIIQKDIKELKFDDFRNINPRQEIIKEEKNEIERNIIPSFNNIEIKEKEETAKPIYVEQKKKISNFEMINQDPSLKSYEWSIRRRNEHFRKKLAELERNEQSLVNFAKSYETMGVHVLPNGDIRYREYAPGCKGVSLFGEFNNWNKEEFWGIKDPYGCWELIIKSDNGRPRIKHGQKIKTNVVLKNNNWVIRNPIWSRYLVQNKKTFIFDSVFWNPDNKYIWKYPKPHMSRPKTLRVYESHVGMATKEQKVGTYREFADNIIPRLKKVGYNALQLMAIMEHADYASFGYHVNNIFAISSRFGTPEDLMYLIDTAHQNGIFVIMDIVHSHASNNVDDGFNFWDGTDYLYFHSGSKGKHTLWDSRLYNYSSYETLRLLLSNCAFYINVYHFDGFRFDGITSVLYKNHGIHHAFTGGYQEYFGDNFDEDGGIYLMLANKLIHEIYPEAITIAEDVSGMPGLCRPVEEGGFGFDYRLNMSICDKWIQLLKEYSDENWDMGNIIFTLTNRRYNEKHIGYCESHDQSIVGDKTISMWLFDKEIYWNMANNAPETFTINRGFALHKMIRMISFALGGEGYLCFMGNEFGHPEWVDFPRPGNNFSYAHCCRRWDLCDNGYLRYKYLYNWDVAMNQLDEVFYFISSPYQYVSTQHEKDKVIVFEKGDLLFVFNFHPTKSFENYKIGSKWKTDHKIILDSDEDKFFGKNRLQHGHENRFPILYNSFNNRPYSMNVYIPSRTCMVLIAEENEKKYDLNQFQQYNKNLIF